MGSCGASQTGTPWFLPLLACAQPVCWGGRSLRIALLVLTLLVKTICTSTVDCTLNWTFAVLARHATELWKRQTRRAISPSLRLQKFSISTPVDSTLFFIADLTFRMPSPSPLPDTSEVIFPSALITTRPAFYSTALR